MLDISKADKSLLSDLRQELKDYIIGANSSVVLTYNEAKLLLMCIDEATKEE